MRSAVLLAALAGFCGTSLMAAQPRFPNPKNPDQILQNDRDLYDEIAVKFASVVSSTGTIENSRLDSSSVTLQGNTFNAPNRLLQLNGSGLVPNALLDSSSVTLQGNTFNAPNKLLQLNGSGLVPNANLDSSSVTLQGNTFNAANKLLQLNGSGLIDNSLIDTSSITKLGNGDIVMPGRVTQPSQPGFLAFNSSADSNVTGNNTTANVDFDSEVYDTASNFSADTFTAPVTGKYLLSAQAALFDVAVGNKCEIRLVTSNRIYAHELWPFSFITLSLTVIADMDTSDVAFVNVNCSGGALVVDIFGTNGSTVSGAETTFFSGTLLN